MCRIHTHTRPHTQPHSHTATQPHSHTVTHTHTYTHRQAQQTARTGELSVLRGWQDTPPHHRLHLDLVLRACHCDLVVASVAASPDNVSTVVVRCSGSGGGSEGTATYPVESHVGQHGESRRGLATHAGTHGAGTMGAGSGRLANKTTAHVSTSTATAPRTGTRAQVHTYARMSVCAVDTTPQRRARPRTTTTRPSPSMLTAMRVCSSWFRSGADRNEYPLHSRLTRSVRRPCRTQPAQQRCASPITRIHASHKPSEQRPAVGHTRIGLAA